MNLQEFVWENKIDNDTPYSWARTVLRHFNNPNIIDIRDMCSSFYLPIEDSQGEMGWISSGKRYGDKAKIWTNPQMTDARKRFGIAHTLGHFLMQGEGTYTDATYIGSQKEENANLFAIHLLCPIYAIVSVCRVADCKIERIAEIFNVPPGIACQALTLYANRSTPIRWDQFLV